MKLCVRARGRRRDWRPLQHLRSTRVGAGGSSGGRYVDTRNSLECPRPGLSFGPGGEEMPTEVLRALHSGSAGASAIPCGRGQSNSLPRIRSRRLRRPRSPRVSKSGGRNWSGSSAMSAALCLGANLHSARSIGCLQQQRRTNSAVR